MNATEVKGSQGAGLVGGSDATSQAVADAESSARAAAEAARKAAEAAAAAAAERNAQKARELEAQAKKLAEAAAKAAKVAANAAAKLEGALQKLEDRGKADPKLAAAAKKATTAARSAQASATAASNSAAAATRARQQKPVDRFETMKDRKLELNPEPRPAPKPMGPVLGPPAPAQQKPWHPPMAPPAQPSPGFTPSPLGFADPFAAKPQKPLTPTERLELARERKLEQAERGGQPARNPVPRDFPANRLIGAGEAERKNGIVIEGEVPLFEQEKAVGWYAFGAGVDTTFESQRSVKASPPRLQPGTDMHTVTFEVKQETKFEMSPGATADNWAFQGRAGTKHAYAHEITYELTVSAKDAERYKQDGQYAPNPFDMRTLPVGGTMVVKMDDVRSTAIELEAGRTVAALPPSPWSKEEEKKIGPPARPELNRVVAGGRVETGGANITGRSVAIERVDEHTVRLMAGPTEGMKGAFGLTGFVTDDEGNFELTGKFEAERSFSTATQRSVDLDMRKPGADAVYAYFLEHGTLPPGGGNAAVASAEVYQVSYKSGAKLEAGVRALEGSASVAVNTEYGVDQKQTFGSDGSASREFTVNNGDRTLQITEAYDAKGNLDLEKTVSSYTLQGVAPELAEGFQRSLYRKYDGPPQAISGPQNLEIQLSHAEANKLNQIAKDYVAQWQEQNNQEFNSAMNPLIWSLAQAQGPDEVSTSLMQAGGHNQDYRELTELSSFQQNRTNGRELLPGRVNVVPQQQ